MIGRFRSVDRLDGMVDGRVRAAARGRLPVGSPSAGAALLCAAVVAAGCQGAEPARHDDRAVPPFEVNGGGRGAVVQERWELALPRDRPVGAITALVRCGPDVYLLDRRWSVVHRVGLERSSWDVLPVRASPLDLSEPPAMAADCAGQRLYVAGRNGVGIFELPAVTFRRAVGLPPEFQVTAGRAVADARARTVYLPGLLPALAYDAMRADPGSMLMSARLGLAVDVESGTSRPLVSGYERGCRAFVAECWHASIDHAGHGGEGMWIAAHKLSRRVGIYGAEGRLVRTIDVGSPRFASDGRTVDPTAPLPAKMAWHEANSTIHDIYWIAPYLVTVHRRHATRNWQPGQWVQFEVHANLHRLDGTGVLSDVRLPDLPVGRDETSLYVVDHGQGGRGSPGTTVALLRIEVGPQMADSSGGWAGPDRR